MSKERIVQIIKDSFNSIYCNSCKYNYYDEDFCDYCDRKSMSWSVSDEYAEAVAGKIIGADDE